jgi:hypothetical protein
LVAVLFLDRENWVFNFFDYMGSDSKRSEEVRRLRDMLIPFLMNRIVVIVGNCPDKKLQYDEM